MMRYFLFIIALLVSPVHAQYHTWVGDRGQFKIEGKFSKVEEGRVLVTKKDGVTIRIEFDDLSDPDQDYLWKQFDSLKKNNHTNWLIRVPQYKSGIQNRGRINLYVPGDGSAGWITEDTYQVPYSYNTYGYEPLAAQLVSFKGNDVTLNGNGGEFTYHYDNFSASDQRFLNDFKKGMGSLASLDSLKTSPTQGVGRYDWRNGSIVDIDSNGTIHDNHGYSGTWAYDDKNHQFCFTYKKINFLARVKKSGELRLRNDKGQVWFVGRVKNDK